MDISNDAVKKAQAGVTQEGRRLIRDSKMQETTAVGTASELEAAGADAAGVRLKCIKEVSFPRPNHIVDWFYYKQLCLSLFYRGQSFEYDLKLANQDTIPRGTANFLEIFDKKKHGSWWMIL